MTALQPSLPARASGDVQISDAETRDRIGFGTPAARAYVLVLLTMIYALSLVDRVAIGIVQEPIKQELQLTDFQLGLLGGPAFAILYSLIGLPLAQLAERRSRKGIISLCLLGWSLAAALCGVAGNYLALCAARLGVSIGEAGCTPPSQSVIVDYFPVSKRATALAIYGLGVPVAGLTAGFGGGWLAEQFGWRMMLIIMSLPGVLLAALLFFTVHEPPRSHNADASMLSLKAVLPELARNRTFWHLTLGASMSGFVGYGLSQYLVSFLMRSHGLSLFEASAFNGTMFGIFAGIGTFSGGYLADRLRPKWPRAAFWLPAVTMLMAVPLYLTGYLSASLWIAGPALMIAAMLNYFYVGSVFAAINTVVRTHLRTMAVAMFILVTTLIGYGLGPPAIGFLSDHLRHLALAHHGLSSAACIPGATPLPDFCAVASAQGLRYATAIAMTGYLWSGLHFLASARSVPKDWARLSSDHGVQL